MTDQLPLSDVRVIETGSLIAGPFCGHLLADFGADVIKVEDPGSGDPMRTWGEMVDGHSLSWPILARGKRSVTCNLRTPAGQQILRDLVAEADVLVENFRPGTLERWGLGPDELARLNPRLIVARVTGYGQHGPYASRAGFGSIGEAMGGVRHVTGEPDQPSSRVGISLGDSLAGTFSALGVLTALHARTQTGRGQVVDTAIYEAVLALMEATVPEWVVAGKERRRTGSILPGVAPSNAYPTADGADVLIGANRDTVFARLTEAMDRTDLLAGPLATHVGRGEAQHELDALIADWTATQKADELLETLHDAGVPAGKVYTAADMVADPHFAAREALVTLAHPDLGEFPMQNVVPHLSDTPGAVRDVGPALGEHTDTVYADLLGADAAQLRRWRDLGVI
ncbi:CaiB/BaiF CoA transferase family protein [Nocardioides euryhalodurans]|uniref:CoA transferase n=1 Tax=Nocardioides euryhalodurans TaxID=2518370 RepID=A0A4P7GLM7_9ACTN|nr:CoA transferase [Nocardioides euryhalodurans]QBR92873.1 CoA transferase [Nocardioides euryhalodurans]